MKQIIEQFNIFISLLFEIQMVLNSSSTLIFHIHTVNCNFFSLVNNPNSEAIKFTFVCKNKFIYTFADVISYSRIAHACYFRRWMLWINQWLTVIIISQRWLPIVRPTFRQNSINLITQHSHNLSFQWPLIHIFTHWINS